MAEESVREQRLSQYRYFMEKNEDGDWEIKSPAHRDPLFTVSNEYEGLRIVQRLRGEFWDIYDHGVDDGYDIAESEKSEL